MLDSGLSYPGKRPGGGHCVVFLNKTLTSHSASLHLGVKIGAGPQGSSIKDTKCWDNHSAEANRLALRNGGRRKFKNS